MTIRDRRCAALLRMVLMLLVSAGILSDGTLSFSSSFSGAGRAFGDEPNWIWQHAGADSRGSVEPMLFRREFSLEAPVDSLVITVACDNRYELYVDGVQLGRGESWEVPERYTVQGLGTAGSHVVAIRAKNDGDDPAGLAVTLETLNGEQTQSIAVSDDSWQAAVESTVPAGWWRIDLPASDAWKPASVLGVVGQTAPWGNRTNWSTPTLVRVMRTARPAQEKFEFVDGDRVTLIGGTWIERLQQDQYFETLVTSAYPDRKITFRNLGWSGDEVTGIARAVFGSPQDGFQRLRDDLTRTAPSVILVGYGGNEAFRGEAGLDGYYQEWLRLVELLESTGAKLVFISPIHHENLGAPLPDPTAINLEIDRYSQAIESWASERGHHFVDFRDPVPATAANGFVPDIRDQLTDNGMHFTEFGNWRTAFALAERLGVPVNPWSVQVELDNRSVLADAADTSPLEVAKDRIRFTLKDHRVPFASPPRNLPRGGELTGPRETLQVKGLAPGVWGLNIDGRPTILADARQWAEGMAVNRGGALDQIEQLRGAIAFKNELHFHRYRPQNETYLFLFRKHEQGNNAVEIPQFDPLIEQQEAAINELKQPRSVTYELIYIPNEN